MHYRADSHSAAQLAYHTAYKETKDTEIVMGLTCFVTGLQHEVKIFKIQWYSLLVTFYLEIIPQCRTCWSENVKGKRPLTSQADDRTLKGTVNKWGMKI
jgi:hypothetical protein